MKQKVNIRPTEMIWKDYTPETVKVSEESKDTWMTTDILRSVYDAVIEDLDKYYSEDLQFDEYGDLVDIRTECIPSSILTLIKHLYVITKVPTRQTVTLTATVTGHSMGQISDAMRRALDKSGLDVTIERMEVTE